MTENIRMTPKLAQQLGDFIEEDLALRFGLADGVRLSLNPWLLSVLARTVAAITA